jgi:probable rRNA maturation factor
LPASIKKRLPRRVVAIVIPLKESLRLNRRYRGKKKPANILSFRYNKEYGEILVCPPVIKREAKKKNQPLPLAMAEMLIHGMIHLSGIHHESSLFHERRFHVLEEKIFASLNHEGRIAAKNFRPL